MIINEARYAAAYVTADDQARRFDDIGGMLAYNQEMSEEVAVFWVHDFDTEAWLKAEEAYFVKSKQITPMGFGIVAFDGQDVEQDGMVMTFAGLLDQDVEADHDAVHNSE
jgi:copper chaperone NosL